MVNDWFLNGVKTAERQKAIIQAKSSTDMCGINALEIDAWAVPHNMINDHPTDIPFFQNSSLTRTARSLASSLATFPFPRSFVPPLKVSSLRQRM